MLARIPQLEKYSTSSFYEKPKFSNYKGNNNKQAHQYNNSKPQQFKYQIPKVEEEIKEEPSSKECPKFINTKMTKEIKLKPAPEFKPKEVEPIADDFIITMDEESIVPEPVKSTDKFEDKFGPSENSNAMNYNQQNITSNNFEKKIVVEESKPEKPKMKKSKKVIQNQELPTTAKSARFSRF